MQTQADVNELLAQVRQRYATLLLFWNPEERDLPEPPLDEAGWMNGEEDVRFDEEVAWSVGQALGWLNGVEAATKTPLDELLAAAMAGLDIEMEDNFGAPFWEELDWADFLKSNHTGLSTDEFVHVVMLAPDEVHQGGGGAAPIWRVRRRPIAGASDAAT